MKQLARALRALLSMRASRAARKCRLRAGIEMMIAEMNGRQPAAACPSYAGGYYGRLPVIAIEIIGNRAWVASNEAPISAQAWQAGVAFGRDVSLKASAIRPRASTYSPHHERAGVMMNGDNSWCAARGDAPSHQTIMTRAV